MCFICRQQMWFALAHRNICITDVQLRPHLNTLSKILALLKLMGILPLTSVGLRFTSPVMKYVARYISLRSTQGNPEKVNNATGDTANPNSGESNDLGGKEGAALLWECFVWRGGRRFYERMCKIVPSIAGSMIERVKPSAGGNTSTSQAWRNKRRMTSVVSKLWKSLNSGNSSMMALLLLGCFSLA